MIGNNKGFTLIELIVVMSVFLFVIGAAVAIFISIIGSESSILSEQQLLSQISYVQEYMSRAIRSAVTDSTGTCLGIESCNGVSCAGYTGLLTRSPGSESFYNGIKFLNQLDVDSSGYPVCEEFYLDTSTNTLKEKKMYHQSDGSYSVVSDAQAVAISSLKISIISIRFGINGFDGKQTSLSSVPFAAGSTPLALGSNNGFASNGSAPSSCKHNPCPVPQSRVTIVINAEVSGSSQPHIIQTTVSKRDF